MNLNKATLIGNLTRDPEVRNLPSGQKVAYLGVATNHSWKDYRTKKKKEKAEYHNIVAWGKLGEIIGQYLNKGDRVFLEGRLQTRSWEDKGGVKRSRTEIVADNLIMLGKSGRAKKDLKEDKVDEKMLVEEVDAEEVPFKN